MTAPVTLYDLRQRTPLPAGKEGRRKPPHMTQEEVAAAVGLDRSVYVNLETGGREFTPHYAQLLEPVLGVEVWALVDTPGRRVNGVEREQLSYLDRLRLLEARDARRAAELRTLAESTTARLVEIGGGAVTLEPRESPPETDDNHHP